MPAVYLPRRLLITGGAGFIGSACARLALTTLPTLTRLVVLDKLTYAGGWDTLAEMDADPRLLCVRGDITDGALLAALLADEQIDAIINGAAETHVDRSLASAGSFIQTDTYGVYVLLEFARAAGVQRVVHLSTDEVYGSIDVGAATEEARLAPRNPYAASKAGGEMLIAAAIATWNMPVLVTRGTNSYGPYQHPEKLIPLFITNALQDLPLPLYGDGQQVRDWLYVDDHAAAILHVLRHGEPGATYNVPAQQPHTNQTVTAAILAALGKSPTLIHHVADRPGHDRRYAMTGTRLARLGWQPTITFADGLLRTISWYVDHPAWWQARRDADFAAYYAQQYGHRAAERP